MAKISDLPLVEAPDGTETGVVLKDGIAKRARFDSVIAAASIPILAAMQLVRDQAGQNAILAGHYANDATDTDVPGGAAGERGAKFWALQAASSLARFLSGTKDLRSASSVVRSFTGAGLRIPLLSSARREVVSIQRYTYEPMWLGGAWPVPNSGPLRKTVSSVRDYSGDIRAIPLISANRRRLLGMNGLTGEPLWMGLSFPVPNSGPVREMARSRRSYSGDISKTPLITLNRVMALGINLLTGEPLWGGASWPTPANSPLRKAANAIRRYTGSGTTLPLITGNRREIISYDKATGLPLWLGGPWPSNSSVAANSVPYILIAASNSPAKIKAVADVVCTGVDDDLRIQAAINALADGGIVLDGGIGVITGGRRGHLHFAEGWYVLSNKVVVPPGSTIKITGAGCSPWIPIGLHVERYNGGTVWYSNDPAGEALHFPKASYPDPADSTKTISQPATGITMYDIEFRAKNPASRTAGSKIVNLDGMITGYVDRINALGDTGGGGAFNIDIGISLMAGASSSRKFIGNLNAYNVRVNGVILATTHISGFGLIDAGNVAGDAYSTCIRIVPQDDVVLPQLHAFGGKYGVGVSGSAALQLHLGSIHCESIDYPMLIDSTWPVEVDVLNLDTGVLWRGDVASSKVVVHKLVKKDGPTKRARQRLQATISSGTSSVTVNHALIAAPASRQATPLGDPGGRFWVTSDATTVTVSVNAPVASDTTFDINLAV